MCTCCSRVIKKYQNVHNSLIIKLNDRYMYAYVLYCNKSNCIVLPETQKQTTIL